MPGIIGNNTVGGVTIVPTGLNRANVNALGLYTAVAGDVVDSIHFYGNNNGSPGANVDFTIYDFSGGVPVNRLNTPAINIIAGSAVSQWWSSPTGLGINLVVGITYCIAMLRILPTLLHSFNVNVSQSVDNSASPPLVWNEIAVNDIDVSIYANVIAGSPDGVPSGICDDFDLLNF